MQCIQIQFQFLIDMSQLNQVSKPDGSTSCKFITKSQLYPVRQPECELDHDLWRALVVGHVALPAALQQPPADPVREGGLKGDNSIENVS